MGGALALAFAATFGAACRLRRLTLMAPAMTTPRPSPFWEAARRGEFSKWLTPDNPEDMAAALENVGADFIFFADDVYRFTPFRKCPATFSTATLDRANYRSQLDKILHAALFYHFIWSYRTVF